MKKRFGHETGSDRDYYRIWTKLPGETRDFVPAIVAPEADGSRRSTCSGRRRARRRGGTH
ncbi:MAG TPA: hypothetical protein VG323_12230 [Thermoanaerobaculia bacterium]|nr:hypothetical protein [Thermoanaerobaculia bacterium]